MTKRTVAIVGRPNVGKSTLFNRIVGRRRAIVHDRPGVTRDRNFGEADWSGHEFWLVDTGGWTVGEDDPISVGIREQVAVAVEAADVVLFVVDTIDGVHPADLEVADVLRPEQDRVIVVANKADDLQNDLSYHEFHQLGLGDPTPVSAATGKGSGDLMDRVVTYLGALSEDHEGDDDVINVAVVGRPNVGKSSIVNRLLGAERSIVSPVPGTTRDAIDSPLRYHGKTLNFIDTAGLRKRLKVKDDVEFYSTVRTTRAIERSDVCVVVVDACEGVHAQDLKVCNQAWDAGAAVVIAVNKWDLIDDKSTQTAEEGRQVAIERGPFLRHVPFAYVSAETGLRVRKLLELIINVAELRSVRITTSEVNRTLEELLRKKQPPQKPGKEVKLFYASQVGVKPPTFAIVTNRPDVIPESYQRFLVNGFYATWDFQGSPIRLKLKRKRGQRR